MRLAGTDAVSVFSVLLRVLGVSVVVISTPFSHHGDTENTEKHKDFKLHHYRLAGGSGQALTKEN